MDEKKKIIIKEIGHWRRSRLLPEQYCDFLLNLYQDEDHSEQSSWNTDSKTLIRNSHWKFWLLFGVISAVVSFVVFNFNSFPLQMQIALSALIIFICYFLGFLYLNKRKNIAYLCFGLGSFILLIIGEYIIKLQQVNDILWTLGYVVACSIVWIVLGIVTQMGVFQFCGWVGLILFYGWLLHTRMDQVHWFQIQMFWFPLTVIFIWLGWLMHHRKKAIGSVYFIVGLLIWFVPDIYLMIMEGTTNSWIQLSFIGKIIIALLVLFLFRKKWTEWVA